MSGVLYHYGNCISQPIVGALLFLAVPPLVSTVYHVPYCLQSCAVWNAIFSFPLLCPSLVLPNIISNPGRLDQEPKCGGCSVKQYQRKDEGLHTGDIAEA